MKVLLLTNFFRRCINGVLRKKTRILCTHHPKFLEEATRILVLNEGKIEQVGSPSKILTKLSNLQPFDENLSEERRTGNGNERRPSITGYLFSEDYFPKKFVTKFLPTGELCSMLKFRIF